MLSGLAIGVLLALAVLFAVYWCAPGLALRGALALTRRAAGLHLREVEVDGHRIPYLDGGRGEPLVLLHGFGANKDNWGLVARHLTPHFRVIVPDLPGFGDASRVPDARYDTHCQLDRLDGFADALGLDRFHLGGNSMGGYLATLYAVRAPARVASLWLLAPAGVLSAPASETFELIAAGANPLVYADVAGFERLGRLCFCRQPWLPPRFRGPLIARARAEAPFSLKIFDEMFGEFVGLEEAAAGLTTRALVVWGDDDRVLHPGGLDGLRGVLANAEFRLMARMGHVPQIERPAETAADFLRFHGRGG